MDKLKELFTKAVKSLECGACVAALVGAKDVAYLNKNWVLDAAAGLCSEFKVMPKDVVSRSKATMLDFLRACSIQRCEFMDDNLLGMSYCLS